MLYNTVDCNIRVCNVCCHYYNLTTKLLILVSLVFHFIWHWAAKENDIFLGWEKGTGKKWGKWKKKGGTDLSLEEMKKQAAVQCLRSASDEVRVLYC